MPATVVALHLTPKSRAPLAPQTEVHALEGQGLQGDRHARTGSHRQVLLVEVETLEALGLAPGAVREQVTVRGLRLNDLPAGARMRIGTAELEVAGPCEPCERMEEIRPGLRAQLDGRRGRFCSVIRAGSFSVGQPLMVDSGAPPGS
jgi:MOSC domain-containing protein YiiM